MGGLWQKTFYINKDVKFSINTPIVEYDIKSGGFNICKYFKLLPEKKLNLLESLNKKDRQIQLGMFMRADKTLVKKVSDGFMKARQMFFEANNIEDDKIISIKKDAIFYMGACEHTKFKNIQFVPKNVYTSYYFIDGNEFYYNENQLDVKGISDDLLEFHRKYMLAFLSNIFRCMEVGSESFARKTLKEFSDYYRNKALEAGYYRELNPQSLFCSNILFRGEYMGLHDVEDLDDINIAYNYTHYIIPLIEILA